MYIIYVHHLTTHSTAHVRLSSMQATTRTRCTTPSSCAPPALSRRCRKPPVARGRWFEPCHPSPHRMKAPTATPSSCWTARPAAPLPGPAVVWTRPTVTSCLPCLTAQSATFPTCQTPPGHWRLGRWSPPICSKS